MGPKKKTPSPKTIKSRLFSGTDPLTVEDFAILSVDGFGSQAAELLDGLNWSKEVYALTGIKLAPDNRRIVSSTVFLLGSIFKNKPFNAGNFWNLTTPTTLSLSINDASVFTFPNGSLCSEFLDSSTFKFSFKQGETTLSTAAQIEAGINGFSVRTLIMPISASKSKLWITIVPISLSDLLTAHPLATNPAFPSLKLLDGDIPLGPASDGPPLDKDWGCPISPAVVLGAPLEEAPNVPLSSTVLAALSAMLRKAVRPEIVTKYNKLLERMQELLDHGVSKLKDLPLEFIWPLPSVPSTSQLSSGRSSSPPLVFLSSPPLLLTFSLLTGFHSFSFSYTR